MSGIVINLLKIYKRISAAIWTYKPAGLVYSACRFHPTCSEYTEEAVRKYGAGKGLLMGLKRLSRCNPLSKRSGYDPVS